MTTRSKISEQAEREFMRSFDREDMKPKIERRQTMLLVDQVANTLLAMKMQPEAKIGIIDVPSCMIATYLDVTVTNQECYLPAFPIHLPMDMGVWSIKGSDGTAYIPVTTGFWDLLGTVDEGLLENQIGFYVRGNKVKFTKATTATVDIELLIVDPGLLGPHDPYPIPADLEGLVVERVVALLRGGPFPPDKPKN